MPNKREEDKTQAIVDAMSELPGPTRRSLTSNPEAEFTDHHTMTIKLDATSGEAILTVPGNTA